MRVEEIRNVYPGDQIPEKGFKCIGIENDKAVVIGRLCRIEDLYFIKSKTKAYFPKKYDTVIGKIIYSSQDFYKVDLGSCTGTLPALSFVNATKRNKPDLDKDDSVICQVEKVVDGDPLLSCKKEGLGKIDEYFPVDSWKIRLFYFNDFIRKISANKSFSIAFGINGFIWLDANPEVKREILDLIEKFGE